MLLVSEIFDEVARLMRTDDVTVFNRISDAAEVLCNKADIDPLLGGVDIVTAGERAFTLPREVDTVLAVNFSGKPSFPRNRWAEFHLNGSGGEDLPAAEYFWDDKGGYPLFKDPSVPVKFAGVLSASGDVGVAELWVYGYDETGARVTSVVSGNTVDGFKVPLALGSSSPGVSDPKFSRVTAIRKTVSKGSIQLYGTSDAAVTELYGVYEFDETVPLYRRIKLSREADWIRVRYRRRVFRVTKATDLIPVHSRYALMLMIKALQKFDDDKIEEGEAYEAKAVQWLMEKQFSTNPPGGPSFQISNATRLVDNKTRLL